MSLLGSYLLNELSMDKFHKRGKDIYLTTIKNSTASKPKACEANLIFQINYKDYPEVEKFTNVKKYNEGEIKLTYNDVAFSPAGIVVDSTFFDVFDFKLKSGNRATVLHDADAIIFSLNLARKMFGNEDPVGKFVTITAKQQKVYTVKGVLDPIPTNSSMTFDFIIPNHSMKYNRLGGNFVLVNNSFNKAYFEEKIEKAKNTGPNRESYKDGEAGIFPLSNLYFEGNNIDTVGIISKHGDKKNINVLVAIITVIFIISLLNFSNLQIININSSFKNIGICKISGAGRKDIFIQKFTQILVLFFISVVTTTPAFYLVLPYFNQIAWVNLSPGLWQIILFNVLILVLLIAGAMIYPVISYCFIPVTDNLKNYAPTPIKLVGRRVLATWQLALSFVLLIASIVVVRQLNLMLNKDLGFNSANIIYTQLFYEPNFSGTKEERIKLNEEFKNNFQFVKSELDVQGAIKNYSLGRSPIEPTEMSWKLKDGDKDYSTQKTLTVTPEYAKLLDLKVLEGRFFDRSIDENNCRKVLINESAKKYWGITDISRQQILNKAWERDDRYEIIGVVKDFYFEHLSVSTDPLIMLNFEDKDKFLIQFEDGSTQAGLQIVKQLFEKNNPGEKFSYSFLSDDIQAMYLKEKRLSKICILFTMIGFTISAIGLFAISYYDTRRRTKEIGVRKVNGAKVSEVMTLLNKDFIRWVAIAFIIATPIAWFAMHKWLENFAYKTTLSWWIFVLSGLLALGIALLTVSWQSWKAATRNPVEALRYE
jgi:putative ABC transport system permease protein